MAADEIVIALTIGAIAVFGIAVIVLAGSGSAIPMMMSDHYR
jgi:hypothetical protein